MGSSLGYLTREGVRNVLHNRLMSLASISVLFSCLVMIGSAFLVFANLNSMIGSIEAQNVIMVFVEDSSTTKETEQLGVEISALLNVASCEFVPKEQAFQQQIDQLGSAADLFEGIDNPLPNAYKVTVADMSNFKTTVKNIEQLDNVLRVRENSDLASKLASLKTAATYISAGAIALLLVVSLFIISNTIRVTMFSRRLEIRIMKSVGATSWFIRWPFMLEGMILGILAGILAELAIWGIYEAVARSLKDLLSTLGRSGALPFSNYWHILLAGFLIVGFLAGAVGSLFSMGKYLKEQECAGIDET